MSFFKRTASYQLKKKEKRFLEAELLQLRPHPFIWMRNSIIKRVGNQRN